MAGQPSLDADSSRQIANTGTDCRSLEGDFDINGVGTGTRTNGEFTLTLFHVLARQGRPSATWFRLRLGESDTLHFEFFDRESASVGVVIEPGACSGNVWTWQSHADGGADGFHSIIDRRWNLPRPTSAELEVEFHETGKTSVIPFFWTDVDARIRARFREVGA